LVLISAERIVGGDFGGGPTPASYRHPAFGCGKPRGSTALISCVLKFNVSGSPNRNREFSVLCWSTRALPAYFNESDRPRALTPWNSQKGRTIQLWNSKRRIGR
jgi:hypothetical protein